MILMLALLTGSAANARTVYVKDYGLDRARTGKERYEAIRNAHEAAVSTGAAISYRGIARIDIEIPKDAKSIPLPLETDFAGVELAVTNNSRKIVLFVLKDEVKEIAVSKEQIESGNFRDNRDIGKGKVLLIVEDQNPWVANRKGYNYGAMRKDVLLLKNGKAQNRTVASYANESSQPKSTYRKVLKKQIRIKNMTFTRTKESEQMTMLFSIVNQDNVLIQNVTVNTPESSDLFGDNAIGVSNSTNIRMEDISINGTYSQSNNFGYGIGMNNVWNAHFIRLNAKSAWGIFGNNNVNHAVIEDSDINRFDIHCYGRDVYCYRTTFRDMYNQFSSMFGELVYEGCRFMNFIPVLFENSYSAYTPFNLAIKNCKIETDFNYPCLVFGGYMSEPNKKARGEIREVSLPNILIENVEVTLKEEQSEWFLFNMKTMPTSSVNHIDDVTVMGLKVVTATGEPAKVSFANKRINTVNDVKFSVQDSSVGTIIRR